MDVLPRIPGDFFFSSRRRHTRCGHDWSSDVCSSDLNPDIPRLMQRESDAILTAVGPRDRVIALEVGGRPWSTEKLASQLESWQQEGQDVSFLVGGPDGLAEACRQRADQQWSLSPLTLPHPLVRILLAEQLYRAWSITRNHPYHRA